MSYLFKGFTGALCDEQINECEPNPCINDGTCHDKVNGFDCECQPGYRGVKCEININECESNPCQNEATCFDLENRYECKCLAGYEGINCEYEIDECLSTPCQNFGTCIDLLASYSCRCPYGFKVCQDKETTKLIPGSREKTVKSSMMNVKSSTVIMEHVSTWLKEVSNVTAMLDLKENSVRLTQMIVLQIHVKEKAVTVMI